MTSEKAKNMLIGKFPNLGEKTKVQREKRLITEVEYSNFLAVLECAINEMKFNILCTITGLDEGDVFSFIYHLADESGTMLNIKTSVPRRDPSIKTIIAYFPAAEIYERELVDLLGVKVEGLPPGKRYPLSDDWPEGEYPLRKDWKQKTLKAETK